MYSIGKKRTHAAPIEMAHGFFDTNVVVYMVSGDASKADLAEAAVAKGGWISVQVLNESARVLHGKHKRDWPAVHAFIEQVSALLQVAPLDIETHRLGLDIAERYKIGVYDSMIVAAALRCGAETLYTEDLHHGLVIDGRLTVVNPFKS